MKKAIIYQPDKTATQSGKSKDSWVFEYVADAPTFVDPLMGWNGMTDTKQEIRLTFPTREAAEKYAKKQGVAFEVRVPNPRKTARRAYADNFKADRRA